MAAAAKSKSKRSPFAVERRLFSRGDFSPVLPAISISRSAEKLKMNRSTLSLLINRKRKAGLSHIPKLAQFLGKTEAEVARLYGSARVQRKMKIVI